jgi:hypothetical protein
LLADFDELLLETRGSCFVDDLVLVDVFLQGQQHLHGIDRFDQVVGNFMTNGLVHDVFFLAFGDHYHRQGRKQGLDLVKGLDAT